MKFLNFSKGKVLRLFDGSTAVGPIHFFLLPTLAYGIGFLFFPSIDAVTNSSLHTSMVTLGENTLSRAWGAVLLLVFLGTFHTMVLKKWKVAHTSAFIGFAAWLFASIMYIQAHNFMLIFAVTIPNMLFWLWMYLRVKTGNTSLDLS